MHIVCSENSLYYSEGEIFAPFGVFFCFTFKITFIFKPWDCIAVGVDFKRCDLCLFYNMRCLLLLNEYV